MEKYITSNLKTELGYFTLDELKSIKGPMGLPIERDRYFSPTALNKIN